MKNKIKTIALAVILGLATVACSDTSTKKAGKKLCQKIHLSSKQTLWLAKAQ